MAVSVLPLPHIAMVGLMVGGTLMTLNKTLYPKSLLIIGAGCFALIVMLMLCGC